MRYALLLSLQLIALSSAALAAEPTLVGSVTTPADTASSTTASHSPPAGKGIYILVAQNPTLEPGGLCEVNVGGVVVQTLVGSAAGGLYPSSFTDGLVSSEVIFPRNPAGASPTVTLEYNPGKASSSVGSGEVTCSLYYQQGINLTPGSTTLSTLTAGPADTLVDGSPGVLDIDYHSWLVLENCSDSSAYGGGAVSLYVDNHALGGLGVFSYFVGDLRASVPRLVAVPIAAEQAVDIGLYYEETSTYDNVGSRCAELTIRRSM